MFLRHIPSDTLFYFLKKLFAFIYFPILNKIHHREYRMMMITIKIGGDVRVKKSSKNYTIFECHPYKIWFGVRCFLYINVF
jgi:hypothetical protein